MVFGCMSEHYNGLLGNLAPNNREIIRNTTNEYEFGEVVLGHAKEFHSLTDTYTVHKNQCSFPPKYCLIVLDKYHMHTVDSMSMCDQ